MIMGLHFFFLEVLKFDKLYLDNEKCFGLENSDIMGILCNHGVGVSN